MAPEPNCPVCGNAVWESAPEPFKLRKADVRVRGGGMAVNAYFCTRCDFLRLHRAGGASDSAEPPERVS
jgi:hypothetical protein